MNRYFKKNCCLEDILFYLVIYLNSLVIYFQCFNDKSLCKLQKHLHKMEKILTLYIQLQSFFTNSRELKAVNEQNNNTYYMSIGLFIVVAP